MQEGSFRCDANVSIKPKGSKTLGTRAEIKNVNSFRFVEKAINYEIARQIDVLENGGTIIQETRLYDADKDETRSMRTKEAAMDYRYFPDPDLLPLLVEPALIEAIAKTMPELPSAKRKRFCLAYELSEYDANNLVASKELAQYFEDTLSKTNAKPKIAANWIMGDLMAALNRDNLEISQSPVSSKALAELLNRIVDDTISGKIAKTVFDAMYRGEGDPDAIIAAKGLKQVTDSGAILAVIDDVLANNPAQLAEYRAGAVKLFGYFVGQVMKLSQGKANPEQVNQLLKDKLSS
jgi:aspartyl-tRNA(Asn)/glutamyl-tRNA(Gln) amidotransferase subunit B